MPEIKAGGRSELAIYDLASAKVTPILTHDEVIEAPNWTPDGAALIVNGGGRLYRVPLDKPALELIDTGFAVKLNNDHGISPDGRTLVISDKTEEGESTIYTLPVTGGVPRRITPVVPSYWHGWSPDGTTFAYTARRDGRFEICTCPAAGGEETLLSRGFDHCDGPDFTPDGEWIWFNGEKDGVVNLWRMRPDGSDLERMTDDDRVNWFPHPSPDGRHVLFLSYEPGTKQHPPDRPVELRLMPAGGGEPQVLLRLHGGQGTINVPCWAPDGQRFAFMHFAPR
jgi:Tol biopolymer transport system component